MGRKIEYKLRREIFATLRQYSCPVDRLVKELLPELLPVDNDRVSMER